MHPCTAIVFVFAAALSAQTITVTASGSLSLVWQGSGPVQTATQQVFGSTSLQVSTVGSAVLTIGPTTTLELEALDPPWPGGSQGWWSSASASVLVSYAADAPLAGVLRLDIDPACIMGMPPMIDVENDGLVEANSWQGTVQVDVPVVLGPRPIPVHLGADTVNFGGATCIVTSSIQFVPLVANLQTAGAACGPSLAASLLPPTQQPGRLTLHVDDDPAAPTSIAAALAFGSTALPTGPTCNPGLIADGWFFVMPTAGGFDLPIPLSSYLTGYVHLQYVGLLLPFSLQLSNRLSLTLP